MEIRFLRLDEVVEIHRDQVNRYGGSHGVRDGGLLESAVAVPSATFDGQLLHADLFEMAAAYLHGIVANHPFIDGNKRAGAMTAFVFLTLNGRSLEAPEGKYEKLVLALAKGGQGRPKSQFS